MNAVDALAAIAHRPQTDFTIEPVKIEAPRAGEVLVKISGVGLCHTDLIARDQLIPIPLPAVLGHEGSGIVESVGEGVTKVQPGDTVILGFKSCGHCKQCDEDLPSYCLQFPALNYAGARPDGSSALRLNDQSISAHFFGQSSFATYAMAHERNVVKVDAEGLPLEILGPLGCGFQTGAGGVMRSMACPAGSSIVIFGGGPVGLAAVMGAVIQQCATIILVEPIEDRRNMALSLGATHVIDPTAGDIAEAVRAILPVGAEFIFETSGRTEVLEAAIACLTSRGMMGMVGVPAKLETMFSVNLAQMITYGYRFIGIIEGDSDLDDFIPELISLMKAGKFPIERLTKTFPLAEINEAIAAQAKGECIKVVLLP